MLENEAPAADAPCSARALATSDGVTALDSSVANCQTSLSATELSPIVPRRPRAVIQMTLPSLTKRLLKGELGQVVGDMSARPGPHCTVGGLSLPRLGLYDGQGQCRADLASSEPPCGDGRAAKGRTE